MMISKGVQQQAFVWIWLPNQTEPVVAGKLQASNEGIVFNYGQNYLEREDAIAIYEPELPLTPGTLALQNHLDMPNCIRDASPDAWGRRVIMNKKSGASGKLVDSNQLDELTYLLESGSDRIGALDFQLSSSEYIPRSMSNVSLDELMESAKRVEKGISLTPELDQALLHGSSIGGARPKALIEDQGKKYIAKFSSSTDIYNVIKAEFIAMRLASLVGLNVASVKLVNASHKDVLLVERFDRKLSDQGWTRQAMVSALTLLGLDEMMARYASYETFAERIRYHFKKPEQTLKELFSRLVFNILCGNTDDHARNHAIFCGSNQFTLTPAYDICPQSRSGNEASQAMLIDGNNNLSQIKTCLKTAHNFLLSDDAVDEIFEQQKSGIKKYWNIVCDEAEISNAEKEMLWERQFLNPYSLLS